MSRGKEEEFMIAQRSFTPEQRRQLFNLVRVVDAKSMTELERENYIACIKKSSFLLQSAVSVFTGIVVSRFMQRMGMSKHPALVMGFSTSTMSLLWFRSMTANLCKAQTLYPRLQNLGIGTDQSSLDKQINSLPDPVLDTTLDLSAATMDFSESTTETYLSDSTTEDSIALSQSKPDADRKQKYTTTFDELRRKHRQELADKRYKQLKVPEQPQVASEPVVETDKENLTDNEPKRVVRQRRNIYGDIID